MNETEKKLIRKLTSGETLSKEEYVQLIDGRDAEADKILADAAAELARKIYGRDIFVRGLIEFTNICKNNCYYCGIRAGNEHVDRYRLTPDQILSCADEGYELGFRTIVLQGGEDVFFADEVLEPIIREMRRRHPDIAITLSLGERSYESFRRLYEAGADRYLIRHETADQEHYRKLHPAEMSYRHRMDCIHQLREIGYYVGVGMMVGSPYQTSGDLAEDLVFIRDFKPEMCGIGPFIPADNTPFADRPAGSLEMTCFLLSVIRLTLPNVLLPATTALGTIDPLGREKGVLSGANVIMPNLSPTSVRNKYLLYNDKICTGDESAQCRNCLDMRMRAIGYRIVTDPGNVRTYQGPGAVTPPAFRAGRASERNGEARV